MNPDLRRVLGAWGKALASGLLLLVCWPNLVANEGHIKGGTIGRDGDKVITRNTCICASMLLFCMANIVLADLPTGTPMNARGVVTDMDGRGTFQIEDSPHRFRLFGLEINGDFPRSELIGKKVACRSVYTLEATIAAGYSLEAVPAYCQFVELFLRGDLHRALLNIGAAKKICDPEGLEPFGCRFYNN